MSGSRRGTGAAHSFRLPHFLAADSDLTRRDSELLVLASETTFLVALELLELLLESELPKTRTGQKASSEYRESQKRDN